MGSRPRLSASPVYTGPFIATGTTVRAMGGEPIRATIVPFRLAKMKLAPPKPPAATCPVGEPPVVKLFLAVTVKGFAEGMV